MDSKLKLVECTSDYWEFVRKCRTDSRNQPGFLTNVSITKSEQEEYMSKNSSKFRICLLDDIPVGYIGTPKDNKIVYCVDNSFKGKGIGTFMVENFGKDRLELEALVKLDNIASQKVFEKLGYSKTLLYTKP